MNYLEILRNNLYVIEYDIAIYNVELTDNYTLGINWNLIPTSTKEIGVTSKTIIGITRGRHEKARRLFIMKRTPRLVITAGFLKFDIGPDNFGNSKSFFYLFYIT